MNFSRSEAGGQSLQQDGARTGCTNLPFPSRQPHTLTVAWVLTETGSPQQQTFIQESESVAVLQLQRLNRDTFSILLKTQFWDITSGVGPGDPTVTPPFWDQSTISQRGLHFSCHWIKDSQLPRHIFNQHTPKELILDIKEKDLVGLRSRACSWKARSLTC